MVNKSIVSLIAMVLMAGYFSAAGQHDTARPKVVRGVPIYTGPSKNMRAWNRVKKDAPGYVLGTSVSGLAINKAMTRTAIVSNINMYSGPFRPLMRAETKYGIANALKSRPAARLFWGMAAVSGAYVLYKHYYGDDEPHKAARLMNQGDEIGKLYGLYRQGAMSKEEYERAKQNVLQQAGK